MPFLKRSGRVKAFLENTTRRVEIFQKSRLGLDASLEGPFPYFCINKQYVQHFLKSAVLHSHTSLTGCSDETDLCTDYNFLENFVVFTILAIFAALELAEPLNNA